MCRIGENIYKRKDGRWEGRYIKGRKEDGKIHYGYIYAKTYQEVKTKLYPLKLKYLKIYQNQGISAVLLKDWMKTWLENEKDKLKPSSYATYYYKMQHYIFPELGNIPLNELTQSEIQQTVQIWIEDRGLAVSTVHVLLFILRKSLNAAVSRKYIMENVATGVNLPKKKRARVQSLTRVQQEKLEAVLKNDYYGLPILVSLYTGLRIGEICALRWADVDLVEKTILIRKNCQRIWDPDSEKTKVIVGTPKTEQSCRKIPISNELSQLLIAKKKDNQSDEKYIFGKYQKPIEPRSLNYHFKRIVKKINEPLLHFHQLRHTFATRCLEVGGTIVSISSMLGHANPKITMDIYLDSHIDEQRKMIESLNSCK